jgi:hypothetical protein
MDMGDSFLEREAVLCRLVVPFLLSMGEGVLIGKVIGVAAEPLLIRFTAVMVG